MMTKNLTILGSTGSIGRQTLEVVEQLPVRVAALTAGQNVERMAEQQTRRLALRRELAVLRAHRLEPKRLAFVKNKSDAAPWLFLVEAQKNRRTGLRIEPDVLITAGAAMYGEVK